MATRSELVAALAITPGSTEVCIKIGEHYHTIDVTQISVRKLFKHADGSLAKMGSADDTMQTVICISGGQ